MQALGVIYQMLRESLQITITYNKCTTYSMENIKIVS